MKAQELHKPRGLAATSPKRRKEIQSLGGKARAKTLTSEYQREIASKPRPRK